MSENCTTPPKVKELGKNEDSSLLGSFYRLKSYKKLKEKGRRKDDTLELVLCGGGEENRSSEVNVYTTPVRSSRRINNKITSLNVRDDTNSELLIMNSPEHEQNRLIFTPNPYISEDIVDELLNEVLMRFRDKVHIVNLKKQPQVADEISEIESLGHKLVDKLCINDSKNEDGCCSDSERRIEQRECKHNDNLEAKDGNVDSIDMNGQDNLKHALLPNKERKEYFISRNKPRVVIGANNQSNATQNSLSNDHKVIAENKYWMVIEFPKNSYLRRKYNCPRILTKKKTINNEGNVKYYSSLEDTIQEYKTLHCELKRLLELSNYCYSPDIY